MEAKESPAAAVRMSPRERVLAIFEGRKPDRVPWFADLTYWHFAEERRGALPEQYRGEEGLARLHRDLECGFYLQLLDPYRIESEVEVREVEKDGRLVRTIQTPVGELREVLSYQPDSFTWSWTEHLVKKLEDLRALRYWLESQRFIPDDTAVQRRIAVCGPNGIGIIALPRTPLSRMQVEFSGIAFLAFAMYDEPEQLEAILQVMEQTDEERYRITCGSSARFVMFPDNLSSEVLSPRWFEKYTLPYYQRRCEPLRAAGKFTLSHLDGTMRGLLPLLARSGVDCVEGLTPAPVGDLEPERLREFAGPKLILWGGVPGSLFSPLHSEKMFEEYVRRYITHHKQVGLPFLLGIGDQLPPDGLIERIHKVREIVDEIGGYK